MSCVKRIVEIAAKEIIGFREIVGACLLSHMLPPKAVVMASRLNIKAWRNWPTLLAKHYCLFLCHYLWTINARCYLDENNDIWLAMLASFARPLLVDGGVQI